MFDTDVLTFIEMIERVGRMVQDTEEDRIPVIKDGLNIAYGIATDRGNWPQLTWDNLRNNSLIQLWDWVSLKAEQAPTILQGTEDEGLIDKEVGIGFQALGLDMKRVDNISLYMQGRTSKQPLEYRDYDDFEALISGDPKATDVPLVWTRAGYTPMPYPMLTTFKIAARSTDSTDSGDIILAINKFAVAQGPSGTANTAEGVDVSDISRHVITLANGAYSSVADVVSAGWGVNRIIIQPEIKGEVTFNFWGTTPDVGPYPIVVPRSSYINSDATEKRTVMRPLIRVWPLPAARYPIFVQYTRKVNRLLNDIDIPIIPACSFMVEFAIGYVFQNMRRHDIAQQHFALANDIMTTILAQQEQDSPAVATPAGLEHRPRARYK